MLPAIAAAGIAAGASALSTGGQIYAAGKMNRKTREWNEKMYSQQRQDALADWQMQNAYNSPQAQMQRFKDAGLNPNLVYGDMSNAPAVRSTESKSWNPSVPPVSGLGQVAMQGLEAYQDFTLQDEQVKNMRAQRKNLELDATLKTVGITGAELKNAIGTVDYNQKLDLYDTAIAKAREQLRAISSGTDIRIRQDARAAALQGGNLTEQLGRIAKLRADTSNVLQQIENAKRTGVLQDLQIGMQKLGINPGDSIIVRMLSRFADGASLKDIIMSLRDQLKDFAPLEKNE